MNRCYFQRWEESERGWGVRPDGCSLHLGIRLLMTISCMLVWLICVMQPVTFHVMVYLIQINYYDGYFS